MLFRSAPLLAGLALVAAIDRVGAGTAAGVGVATALKWPNDLLLGPERRKGAGILVEADGAGADGALVVGVGLNVTTTREALPEGATSLAAEGGPTDRTTLLLALLDEVAALDDRWRAARGDVASAGLLEDYRARCATLGTPVRVALPGDRVLSGRAVDVDPSGHLLVRDGSGDTTAVSAGDVVHVRPVGG